MQPHTAKVLHLLPRPLLPWQTPWWQAHRRHPCRRNSAVSGGREACTAANPLQAEQCSQQRAARRHILTYLCFKAGYDDDAVGEVRDCSGGPAAKGPAGLRQHSAHGFRATKLHQAAKSTRQEAGGWIGAGSQGVS